MIDRLRKDLEQDEGVRYKIYLDHLGLPTAGIGRLLTTDDPEFTQPVGSAIDKERVNAWFQIDIKTCLANMAFNLGGPRLRKFKNLIDAVHHEDYARAAQEMFLSRWRKQVPYRANRLIDRMRALA